MCVCVGGGILSGHWGAPAAPSCPQWSVAFVISSDVLSWQSFCSCWQSLPASHVAGPVIYHTVLFALNIKLAFFYKSIHFSYSNDWVIVLNFYNHILSLTLKYHMPWDSYLSVLWLYAFNGLVKGSRHWNQLVAYAFARHALYVRTLRYVLLLCNHQICAKAQRLASVVNSHLMNGSIVVTQRIVDGHLSVI